MSVESPHQNHSHERSLRDDERALLLALLSGRPDFERFAEEISSATVSDMSDGGMGSVEFVVSEGRSLGATLVEAEYLDVDGVSVNITVNTDDRGGLYELDFWKTDFSPLKQYPRPNQLKIKPSLMQ